MKFVKGDVIAGFLIIIINILGGVAIGVGQRDMELTAALKRYGLLTIGDGLVSQIPALVIATAAGVLVTRVASEEPDTPLGEELSNQIFGAPRALRMAAIFVFILALIPGLPALPFFVIGALLFVGSRARQRQLHSEEQQALAEPVQRRPGEAAGPRFVPVVVPWSLDVSADLAAVVEDDLRGDQLRRPGIRSAGPAVQEVLFRELGVPLPPCRVTVIDDLPERCVVLAIHEVPAHVLAIPADVSDDDIAAWIVDRALVALRARAADFVGIAEAQVLLDQLEQVAPATVRQVVPKPVTLTLLSDILRRLVEEGVSIRDLKGILESLAQVANVDKDPLNLTEFVRSQMRRALTHELTAGSGEVGVVLLDPQIEETIRGAISRTAAGSFLTLAPAAGRDIVTSIKRALGGEAPLAPVILTQPDIRRFVKKLVEMDLPSARVVSYAELLPEVRIVPIGKATLSGL